MKPLIILMALFFTMSLFLTASSESLPMVKGPDGEKLAGIALGDKVTTVVKILGKPDKKTKEEIWGADGLKHQNFIYSSKGIEINFADGKVFTISISSPCKGGTSRGIKIGDNGSKVRDHYVINENESSVTNLICGTIYYGIIFQLTDDGKVKSIAMGSFAE